MNLIGLAVPNRSMNRSNYQITRLPDYQIRRLPLARRLAWLPFVAVTLLPVAAQTAKPITIQVSETTGIRRTEYPTNAKVQIPRAAMANADHVRLRANNADVPAQFAVAAKWEDGSVRTLDVDFNVSILPGESRTFQLEYGPDITPGPVARGL